MAKKRKWSRNRSVLADIPIGETSWYEWRIELLLLAELAARKDGVDQAMNLFDSIEKRTGRQFDGSMSSWREISNATPTELVNVRAENPAFFFGLTNALLSMFNLTVPLPDGAVPDCTQTEMNRLALIEHMNEGVSSPLSTRVKALHSLLFAKSRGNAEEIGEMELEARAVFERFDGAGAEQRSCALARNAADESWRQSRLCRRVYRIVSRNAVRRDCLHPAEKETVADEGLDGNRRPRPRGVPGVLEPRPTIPVDQSDVIVGTLVRIGDLFDRVLSASGDDDGLPAELYERSLTDSVIQLRWLLQRNDDSNFTKFKEHSLAQERDALEQVVGELKIRAWPKKRPGRSFDAIMLN